jgi:hypothetical protein
MAEIGNTNAQKHGGRAAVEAVAHDKPFTGKAIMQQADVIEELDTQGVDAILERAAVRLQTVSDLFYAAIQAAAQANDFEKIDNYTKRFGWIQSKAVQAWAQVKINRKHSKGKLSEVLTAYSEEEK